MPIVQAETSKYQHQELVKEATVTGTQIALGRLFRADSGRSFITAYDHGTNLKVPASTGKPLDVLDLIVQGDPDGVLLSAGMLRAGASLFAHRGAPVPVLRADWTVINDDWKRDAGEHYKVMVSPAEAQALGAGAICMYLIMGPAHGSTFADNVQQVAKAAVEAHRVGLPLIVEATLWGTRHADKRDAEALQHACRMAYEIGADAIKTEFTGDVESMRQIIDSVAVPVLTLGGAEGERADVIASAQQAIEAGASGLIFGRNVWNTPDPVGTTAELVTIVHGTR